MLRDIGYAAYFVGVRLANSKNLLPHLANRYQYEGTLRFFPGSTAKSAPWYATLVAGGVAGIGKLFLAYIERKKNSYIMHGTY